MNIKTTTFLVLSAVSAAAFAAVPTVSNVQLSGGSKARITYDLSGDPGIVTLEIQTNTVADLSGKWLPINGQFLRNVAGDVSCVVQPGNGHLIKWPAKEALGEPLKNARAVLTAWATNAPPDWCIGDILGEDVARYYTSTNYFPLGFGHDVYKTSKIVFKLVKARGCTFSMGCPAGLGPESWDNSAPPHDVTMTRDYYLAIYEVTQAQYYLATGNWSPYGTSSSNWKGDATVEEKGSSKLAADFCWRNQWRGTSYVSFWLHGYTVDKDSFIGRARSRTGLFIEFPTEAEWEFAARCGGYRLNNTRRQMGENGTYLTKDETAWARSIGDVECKLHEVGLLKPNCWGFYDMCGNVNEGCIDYDSTGNYNNGAPAIDPIGTTTGDGPKGRGGAYQQSTYSENVFYRGSGAGGSNGNGGLRPVVVLERHPAVIDK